MLKTRSRPNALTALLLLVSAACLGRIMALYAPSLLGRIVFSLCQVGLLALPLVWFFGSIAASSVYRYRSDASC
jgi:hypothetical protein